jgi:hypothetical protein
MRRRLLQCAAVVAIAGILAAPASAAVITLGASREATIFENNVDNSNGAGPVRFAGTNGQHALRSGCRLPRELHGWQSPDWRHRDGLGPGAPSWAVDRDRGAQLQPWPRAPSHTGQCAIDVRGGQW